MSEAPETIDAKLSRLGRLLAEELRPHELYFTLMVGNGKGEIRAVSDVPPDWTLGMLQAAANHVSNMIEVSEMRTEGHA